VTWIIHFTDEARKEVQGLDPSVAHRVARALERLANSGYGDVKHLHQQGDTNRLRVGDWRVLSCLTDLRRPFTLCASATAARHTNTLGKAALL